MARPAGSPCICGLTATPPVCDGAHSALGKRRRDLATPLKLADPRIQRVVSLDEPGLIGDTENRPNRSAFETSPEDKDFSMHDHGSGAGRLTPAEVETRIAAALPGARVAVRDLTGTQDHLDATVVWDGFQGKSLVEQHRLVNTALAEELKGPIHALKLATLTPAQAMAKGV
jgi:stress-induced morphogen